MSRYIDVDALKKRMLSVFEDDGIGVVLNGYWDSKLVREIIDEQQTADVAEVVRCDNCMWNYIHVTPKGKDYHICKLLNLAFDNDDKFFCAYGEKKKRDGEPIPHWRGQTDNCLPFQTEVKE